MSGTLAQPDPDDSSKGEGEKGGFETETKKSTTELWRDASQDGHQHVKDHQHVALGALYLKEQLVDWNETPSVWLIFFRWESDLKTGRVCL